MPGFSSPYFGFYVAGALAVVAVSKGLLLAQYNYRLSVIACRWGGGGGGREREEGIGGRERGQVGGGGVLT